MCVVLLHAGGFAHVVGDGHVGACTCVCVFVCLQSEVAMCVQVGMCACVRVRALECVCGQGEWVCQHVMSDFVY